MGEKIHDLIFKTVMFPVIVYYIALECIDAVRERDRILADKLFLKRIRMTQKEFDEFLEYKRSKSEQE